LTFALALAVTSPSSAVLDKTRFLAHVGVAYFAFHHWVLKPYQEQKFTEGAPHRTAAIVKGGAALLFAVHELRVAQNIAHKSSDPLLEKLDAGVTGLMTSFEGVGQRMKSGTFSPTDVQSLSSDTSSVSSEAAAGGAQIKDVPATIPGT
jgi:hypothetical protein